MYEENYEKLKEQVSFDKNLRHTIKDSLLFPFTTRKNERITLERGFKGIFGEFSRLVCEKALPESFSNEKMIEDILCSEELKSSNEDKKYLKKLIREYLVDNNELNIVHPYLFLYTFPTGGDSGKGEIKIAEFMKEIFLKDVDEFKYFYEKEEELDFFSLLILENIEKLADKKTEIKYYSKLDFITKIFNEDMKFALKNKDFLIKNAESIFAYYYFYYITQLSLKLKKENNDLVNEPEELYYLLDWESIGKKRKTVKKGYQFLKDNYKELFAEINRMEHINILLGTKRLFYSELKEHWENLYEEDQKDFIYYFKLWIKDYRLKNKFISDEFDELYSNDFESLNKIFLNSLIDGIPAATRSRYPLSIEAIARKYFIKRRGSYGFVLNIKQDMLLLITQLCIKNNKKIKLIHLFEEYNKRGLYFDRDSQFKIIDLLNNLNLIDKKSDSGDAQYVKSIL